MSVTVSATAGAPALPQGGARLRTFPGMRGENRTEPRDP